MWQRTDDDDDDIEYSKQTESNKKILACVHAYVMLKGV